jgi:hypothetical protein
MRDSPYDILVTSANGSKLGKTGGECITDCLLIGHNGGKFLLLSRFTVLTYCTSNLFENTKKQLGTNLLILRSLFRI